MNATLNALRIANVENEFITVSPVTGVGDYTSIVDAVDAGHKYIFVKAGIYTETADIVLNGQNLIGESPESTIIRLADHSIEFETHDATNAYDNGTAQLVNNSTQVNGGGGTLWDTGANAPSGYEEPWLIIRGMAYPIESFVNDTTLNLREQYRGDTQTGNYYIIDAMNIGSLFTGFRVEHSPTVATPCMLISGIGVTIDRNIFQCDRLNTSYGIRLGVDTNSVAAMVKIRDNQIISGSIGIELKNSHSCCVRGNQLQDQNDHGIRTDTTDHDCYGNEILENKIYGCSSTAIELDGGSLYTTIRGNELRYCRNIGIDMDDCDHCQIVENKIDTVTTGVTVQMQNNCMWCTISDNQSIPGDWDLDTSQSRCCGNLLVDGSILITGSNNQVNDNEILSGQIAISGSDCLVNDNLIYYALATYGIDLDGTSNTAVGNVLRDCEDSGIGLDGAGGHVCANNMIDTVPGNGIDLEAPDCVVADNVILQVTGYGIETDQTADDCVIKGNRIESNAGNTAIRIVNERSIVEGNLMEGMGAGYGVHVRQLGAGDGDETLIRGNKIKTAAIGIFVDAANGLCKVDGNHISTTTTYGIQIDSVGGYNFTINNNTIINAGSVAIFISNGGRYSTVNNNVIQNPISHGIHFQTGLTDLHGTINGNAIHSAGGSGIFLDREGQAAGDRNDHMIIDGNNVHNSTGAGIVCGSLRCIISNNRVDDGTGTGMIVRNGDQTIVSGNGCDNNGANGIQIDNTADRIIITSNICLNNVANQILNNGTNTVAANNIVV